MTKHEETDLVLLSLFNCNLLMNMNLFSVLLDAWIRNYQNNIIHITRGLKSIFVRRQSSKLINLRPFGQFGGCKTAQQHPQPKPLNLMGLYDYVMRFSCPHFIPLLLWTKKDGIYIIFILVIEFCNTFIAAVDFVSC